MSSEARHTSGVTAPAQQQRRLRLLLALTLSLLICSVLLNVLLARRVAALSGTLLDVKAENRLSAGTSVPPINAKDLDGNPASVSYAADDIPTVLYVFTPECGWCEKNVGSVRSFAEQVRGKYRVVGVSLSSEQLRGYVAEKGFAFPVLTELQPSVVTAYKLGGTPQTIVVSGGKVVKSWQGAYLGETKGEIEGYFNVRLPGLEARASR